MTHDPVDQLLEDLDTALSVRPSPAVAAQVRRRIDAHGRSVGPRFGLWAGGAVAAAAVLATTYTTWNRIQPEATRDERSAVHAPLADGAEAEQRMPTTEVTEVIAEGGTRHAPAPEVTSRRVLVEAPRRMIVLTESEPDVVVSPADRLGFEQLQAAVSAGRITAETLVSVAVNLEPTIVIPTMVSIRQTPVPGSSPGTTRDERVIDGTDVARPGGSHLVFETIPPSFVRSAS